ncbi:MAG: hypothetical protein K8T89_17480, partial [Planctomycetes bacterium]|nr:hypothetical protein [Planctomycetota bacterium]
MKNSKDQPETSAPSPQELGESLAAQIGHEEWELDTPDEGIADGLLPEPVAEAEAVEPEVPLAEADFESEVPPSPLQIIEAMLFIGGQPLKAEKACEIIRGLAEEQFRELIDVLNRVYRLQNRPYLIA